jgi:hypothetical protein
VRLPTDLVTDAEEVSHIPDHGTRDATLIDIDVPAETGDIRGRKKDAPVVPVVTVSAPSP